MLEISSKKTPPFFHLRPTLGTVWPGLPSPQAASLWSAYLELDRTQWLAPAEIEQLQLRQVRALLAHCAAPMFPSTAVCSTSTTSNLST